MRSKDDTGLLVRFYKTMERNDVRSAVTGKSEFDEVECISIRVPGSRDEHVALVNDEYRDRFKDEYRGWKANEGAPITGTPLGEWPAATVSFVDEMKLVGVRTVEELASMSDGHAMVTPGLQTMKARAVAWLHGQDGAAELARVNAERDELLARIAALEGATKPKRTTKPGAVNISEISDEELEAMTNPVAA